MTCIASRLLLAAVLCLPAVVPAHHDGDVETRTFRVSGNALPLLQQRVADGSVDSFLYGRTPAEQRGPHQFVVDVRQRTVVVTDTPANLDRMERYLSGLNAATAPRLHWRTFHLAPGAAERLAPVLQLGATAPEASTWATPGREIVLDGDVLRVRESAAEQAQLTSLLLDRGLMDQDGWRPLATDPQMTVEMRLVNPGRVPESTWALFEHGPVAHPLPWEAEVSLMEAGTWGTTQLSCYPGAGIRLTVGLPAPGETAGSREYSSILEYAYQPLPDERAGTVTFEGLAVRQSDLEGATDTVLAGDLMVPAGTWVLHPASGRIVGLSGIPEDTRLLVRADILED